jgi:hypothetical protein
MQADRPAHRSIGLGICLCAALWLLGSAQAWAVDEHAFDPDLSLRGDTVVTKIDEVPDPGSIHPKRTFENACGTATDSFGNIYVANGNIEDVNGWIDVFNSNGEFLTEIADEKGDQPCSLAVDSEGNVYTAGFGTKNVVRFAPEAYPPVLGTKYLYKGNVFTSNGGICKSAWTVAIDPSTDHLYAGLSCKILEYDSASNGNGLIDENIGAGLGCNYGGVGVYGASHNVYVSGTTLSDCAGADPANQRVFILNPAGTQVETEIKGPEDAEGEPENFGFLFGISALAVDQANGDVYVDDVDGHQAIEQFDAQGEYIGRFEYHLAVSGGRPKVGLAVDDPCRAGPTLSEACKVGEEYESPNEGYVYVAQGHASSVHLFAFKPLIFSPPIVEGQVAQEITETEAVLRAQVNPGGKPSTFHFEYISEEDYIADGNQYGAGTAVTPDRDAGSGGAFIGISQAVSGLAPGTAYRFRLVASNCIEPEEGNCLTQGEGVPGGEGGDASFSTYAVDVGLPDARAYELVTPPDTNGRTPTMTELGGGINASGFDTTLATSDGESIIFGTEGGSIPALGGGGYHDTYEAERSSAGWVSHFAGLSGAQAEEPSPGGISSDHAFAFWSIFGAKGSLATGGETSANYIRRPADVLNPACSPEPAGSFEFVGCGSLGVEPYAQGRWISADGSHVILEVNLAHNFVLGKALEPCAKDGVSTIYDRTPDGVTHCIVLPPEGATAEELAKFEGSPAIYKGVSRDGTAVAFELDEKLYVRIDNEKTLKVASGPLDFAGLSNDGSRLAYLKNPSGTEVRQGELFTFDTETAGTTQVGSGGKSIVTNISPSGTHIYFVSEKSLTPTSEKNENGEHAEANKRNLYLWNEGTLRFIAQLTKADIEGEDGVAGSKVGGLGLWVGYAVAQAPEPKRQKGPAADPSRTTPDGSVFVFQSSAKLGDYENEGHAEVYRFDPAAEAGSRLTCVSCNPTGVVAKSNAQLESNTAAELLPGAPINALSQISNVTADGRSVFFQSADKLARRDVDGKVDIYEWVEDGAGACTAPGGCVYLISGGQSGTDDYLYAMSPDGNDVFFETGDTLVPQDPDRTPSIYDARAPHESGEAVGFPPPPTPPTECLGEACQPAVVVPNDPTPSSSNAEGAGNPKPAGCREGSHEARRNGKKRCVKNRGRHHRKHRRAHPERRASR